mmetsp:Transcript_2470/g.3256  ORF Transcript_2470/g.3256 Transcript_2470/m.3256 type:complete len:86 (+) Transcript_2470:235-492(+)
MKSSLQNSVLLENFSGILWTPFVPPIELLDSCCAALKDQARNAQISNVTTLEFQNTTSSFAGTKVQKANNAKHQHLDSSSSKRSA